MFCGKDTHLIKAPHALAVNCGPQKFPRKLDFMLAGGFVTCSNLQPPLGSAVFCCSKCVLESILWWEHNGTVDKLPAEHGDCCRFTCQCSDLTGSLQNIASCMWPTRNLQCVSTYIRQIVTNLRSLMIGYLTRGIGAIQINDQLPMSVRDSQSGHVLIEATGSCENRYLKDVSSVCCDNECKCADGLPASSRSHQCQVKQLALLGYPRG